MAALFNIPWLTESIKKCTIKCLIERYLGQFLYEELDLSQLDIELFNGTASIESIPLNVKKINTELPAAYFPLKFLKGFVNKIEFSVPWSSLWTDSCSIQLNGIRLDLCKLQQDEQQQFNNNQQTTSSILSKSMMISSMEMAGEILQQESEKYEGLEKFAQLINSIIRRVKLSAKDTHIKFKLPKILQKNNNSIDDDDDEIEFRIGFIKCEEEEIAIDNNDNDNTNGDDKSNNNNLILSDVITKRITIEGIELYINSTLITKLYGKHTIKIRFNENRIDIDTYLGSYIFAILNIDHIRLLQLFIQMIQINQTNIKSNQQLTQPKERLMTELDYRRIQELLYKEKIMPLTSSSSVNSKSFGNNNNGGGRTWITCSSNLDDDEFKSFHRDNDDNNNNDNDNGKKESSSDNNNNGDPKSTTLIECNIKIPGIVFCLITDNDDDNKSTNTNNPIIDEMPFIDNLIGINSYLDDILQNNNHIRLLASNLCIEIHNNDQIQFSCINISSYEFHQGILENLFWINDQQQQRQQLKQQSIMPSIRLKKLKNVIDIMMAPISIRLDPTIIERHPKLFELFIDNVNIDVVDDNTTTLELNLECNHIDLEFYFPIPDLRPERNDYSRLHDEILLLQINHLSATISEDSGEFLCKEIVADLRIDNDNDDDNNNNNEHNEYKLFHSKCNDADDNIKFYYSMSSTPSSTTILNEPFHINDNNRNNNNNNDIINSMHESINFLQSSSTFINHNNNKRNDEPFQVKRNLFGDGKTINNSDNYERIITPGDRDHCRHFIANNRNRTKFYTYIHLPDGEIFLENKKIFELIYNRFANDLILWRPFFPPVTIDSYPPDLSRHKSPPKLLIPMLDDDDDDDDDDDINSDSDINDDENINVKLKTTTNTSTTIFHSCKIMNDSTVSSDNSYHSSMDDTCIDDDLRLHNETMMMMNQQQTSKDFVIEIEIDHLWTRFKTTKSKLKNEIFLQNFLLAIVGDSGCGGGGNCNNNFNNNNSTNNNSNNNGNTVICFCSDNFQLKCSEQSLIISNHCIGDLKSELNAAIEIRHNDGGGEYLKKKIKLTLQLKHSLLLSIDISIFDDLWNFINVKDDEILGYICPRVTIELHIDLMKCGILFDYSNSNYLKSINHRHQRQTLIHVEDIYLTSMVVENTDETILRFFIEEALLCFKRNNNNDDQLIKNFIPVIDSGIIDINLKISKDGRIEWKGSNNEINLKVCYDSLAALFMFLQSFSTTLAPPPPSSSSVDSTTNNNNNFNDNDKDNDNNHQQQQITTINNNNCNELLADALSECISTTDNDSCNNDDDDETATLKQKSNEIIGSSKMDESNFLILGENDLGSGINISKEPRIRCLIDDDDDEPLIKLIDNHFTITHFSGIPDITATTIARYLLDRMSLNVYLYAGKDFDDDETIDNNVNDNGDNNKNNNNNNQQTKNQDNQSIMKQSQRVRFKNNNNNNNSVLWENIDLISTTTAKNQSSINNPIETHFSFKSIGGSRRKSNTYIVLVLKRIRLLFDQFDSNELTSWIFRFMVQELEIIDKVSVSKINKMLYEYYSESMPRRQYSNMFSIRMSCQRNFQDQFEEADLTVSLKPLRVNVDQDTLLFLMDFFQKFNDTLTAKLSNNNKQFDVDLVVQQNDFSHIDDECDIKHKQLDNHNNNSKHNNNAIFIKSFTFLPEVPIRLDYHGKHIDLKQGALPGIALGLAQLSQSELYLKKLSNKHGLLGIDKVLQYAVEEWARDIKRNQLPSILGGVGPMHSFIQLFQGIRDLFWIPIDQYRRDQRIVRGIQRGAYAFSVSTAMATLELANRLVVLIQNTAQFAHNVVTPPTPRQHPHHNHHHHHHHHQNHNHHHHHHHHNRHHQLILASQPRDLREGFTTAYAVIREGFHDTIRGMTNTNLVADDTVTVISEVVRQIPSTVVRPIIHLSQATSSVLVGFRNQLTPEARKDDQEKWKNANDW